MRPAWSGWACLALIGVVTVESACASTRCKGRRSAECAWLDAVGEPSNTRVDGPDASPEERRTTVELAASTSDAWGNVEQILGKMAVLMADGMGADVTADQARAFCSEPPTLDAEAPRAWFCKPAESTSIDGHELMLEVGTDGVVALTARPLTPDEVMESSELAEARWGAWCVGSFRDQADEEGEMSVRMCALPGGPSLAIVRAPRDEAARQWQLTLAVMPAG